jgi:glutamate-1-semialdehyde 2,1-aminomutase
MNTRTKSAELFNKLLSAIPGGVNSPTRAFTGMGITPLIVERGKGDQIIDLDGNTYIDCNMAWGSLILGHVFPEVEQSTKAQIEKGSSFGITTKIEYDLAQKLKECVPSIEKSRVVASGTEATMTAVRIARAYTKRNILIKFNGHYHGHSDAFLVKAGSGVSHHFEDSSSKGVPKEVVQYSISLPFNDEEAFVKCIQEYHSQIAAVILEPIAGNMGVVPATSSFIQLLRKTTEEIEALLIFDEVITGFRVGKGGAQAYYNVTPDLSTFSKIIGGGYPVGVVGGRADIMDMLAPLGPVYQAGTLSGNPVALQGGYAVLQQITKPSFYEQLQKKMDQWIQPVEEMVQSHPFPVCLNRVGSMFSLFFGVREVNSFEEIQDLDRDLFNRFFIHLFERGIYISPSPFEASFISAAHTEEHLLHVQKTILEFLLLLKEEMKAGSLTHEYATSKR